MFNLPIPPIPIPGMGLTTPLALPVGTVVAFAGKIASSPSEEPSNYTTHIEALGWMVCDGRTFKISEYPELFAVLGYLYGGEEKDGTFQIPDYRGIFLRGVESRPENDLKMKDPDRFKRESPSANGTKDGVGSTQKDALQNHQHRYWQAPPPTGSGNSGTSGQPPPSKPNALTGEPTNEEKDEEKAVRVSTETRPKNVYIYYIIKYTNLSC